MRLDVYEHPDRRSRQAFPFVVQLQSDIADGETRIAAPLVSAALAGRGPTRTLHAVLHDGSEYLVATTMMGTVETRALRRSVGSVMAWHDDIARALDRLFYGI
jgi:toxin CcdB